MVSASASIPVGYKKTEVGVIPEDWHVVNIDSIARVKTGAKDTQDKIDDGDFPFFVRSQKVERINSFSFDGEAVLTAGDGVGTGKIFHYIVGKFDYHQRVYCMSGFSNCTGKYFYYQFSHNFYDRIMSMTAKSSVDSVRKAMITEMKIPLPPHKTEQDKIAKTLSDSDSQIQALEQLIAKKRDIKQGSMQTLLTGKSRLPGFSGEWECIRLKDFLKTPVTDGPHLTPKFHRTGIPFLSVNNLVNNRVDFSELRYISEDDHFQFSKKCKPERNDILLGKAASVGKVAIVDFDLELNIWSPLALIRVNEKHDPKFVFYSFQSRNILNQIELFTNSSSQGNIGMGDIELLIFNLPEKNEQVAIAQVLSDMDAEISALEQRLEKTKAIKQGMMQQLLTGRIRLVDPSTPVEASA